MADATLEQTPRHLREAVDERGFPLYSNAHIETMSRADIETLQENRLLSVLPIFYERSPLVRETWDAAGLHPRDIKSLADFFAKAPFVSKDIVREHRDRNNDPAGGLNIMTRGELRGIGTTSGTTGDPTPKLRGPYYMSDHMGIRDYWWIGARPGDYVAHILFTFHGGVSYRTLREHQMCPIHFTHAPYELERLFQASKIYRPTLLRNVSNPLIHAMEEVLERTGEDPRDIFKSYKGAIFGGEALGSRQRMLAESWGLELYEQTTLGDICSATDCRAHAGMHAHEDVAIIECLDPDGDDPVPDGQVGEFVVTGITTTGMPLLRYRTDDLVWIDRSPCICGVTHTRFRPIGRKGDQIIVEGKAILPADVQKVIESVNESRAGLFQIIRPGREMDKIKIRLGYAEALMTGTPASLASRVEALLTETLGVPAYVEVTPNEELLKLGPPHKIPRVTKS